MGASRTTNVKKASQSAETAKTLLPVIALFLEVNRASGRPGPRSRPAHVKHPSSAATFHTEIENPGHQTHQQRSKKGRPKRLDHDAAYQRPDQLEYQGIENQKKETKRHQGEGQSK